MKKSILILSLLLLTSCGDNKMMGQDNERSEGEIMDTTTNRSEQEWKGCLTEEEYNILREKGTERAFTGKYNAHYEDGVYTCAGCGAELFSSETKYNSGSGWPAFYQPMNSENIAEKEDNSWGMVRTEVKCSKCGGHLGHVFEDGPNPTGMRYCINSVSLNFKPQDEVEKEDKDTEEDNSK